MPRIFRHIAQRMVILFLLLGGMGLVCQEAQAAPAARAMWDANTKTLTFYYGEQKSGGTTHYSGTQITATGSTFPAWYNSSIYSNITTVVFESSFASVRPTSCNSWFRNMSKLTTITGINYLKTDNVTSMYSMFDGCSGLTSLNLSSFNTAKVTSMSYMFYGCSGLTSLNLSSFNTDNVTSMNCMFDGCSGLTSLNLSSFNTAKVTSMAYMFNGCSGLTSLNLSSFNTANVTGMWRMFTNCSSLTSLDLRSFNTAKVTDMDAMFKGCSNLQIIYVDESKWSTAAVTSSTDMFYGCTKLVGGNGTVFNSSYTDQTRARVDKPGQVGYLTCATEYGTCGANGDNLTWLLSCDGTLTISGSGAMADWSSSDKVPWYSYRSSITTVNIRDGVTSVGNRAFIECTALTSVTIPNSVTSINNNAFFSCSALANITIPNNVTTIGQYVFYGCSALTNITIPGSVTSLGENTFRNCSALTDMYVSWIGTDILELPTNIHNSASEIKLHIPCGQAGAYFAKGWNTKFTLPNVTSGTCGDNVQWTFESCNGTLSIFGTGPMADYAQLSIVNQNQYIVNSTPWRNYDVQTVKIYAGVTTIGAGAFYYVRNTLTSVTMANTITSIGEVAFIQCASLTSIEFSTALNSINNAAFKLCSSLTSISLPNGISTIGKEAFFKCGMTSFTIPISVTSLGKACIANDILTDIYVGWTISDAIPEYNSLTSTNMTATLHVPCGTTSLYQAAEGWQDYTIVEDRAHGTCGAQGDNLTWSLSCDGTLTISGTGEMYNWMSLADRPWHSLCTSIQRVVIEEGVTTTGLHAFYGASNLTSVSLPSTLQTLQFMTFFGCGKLTTLTIPSSVTYVGNRSLEGCSALTDVYMSETGDAIPTMPAGIHTYDASRIRLHIPCGQAVNYIAKGWNTKFTIDGVVSGTCGDNVQWTFESCNGTLSIFGTGPMADYDYKGTPWKPYRQSIISITIANGVTGIGEWAFYGCTNLTSVAISNSVTSIGKVAFDDCKSLPSISIPNSVTSIGLMAFEWCTGLTSITIPNSITCIEPSTFEHCTSLSSVTIPNSVTEIAFDAFYYCTSLSSITIPNSVTNIEYSAFSMCTSLTDIYVSWTSAEAIPLWDEMTDNDPQSSITLHVPCSAMSLYKAAEGWKDYTIEGEGGPYTITVESDDPTMGTVDAIKIDN